MLTSMRENVLPFDDSETLRVEAGDAAETPAARAKQQ
jgi:hypothetical protein